MANTYVNLAKSPASCFALNAIPVKAEDGSTMVVTTPMSRWTAWPQSQVGSDTGTREQVLRPCKLMIAFALHDMPCEEARKTVTSAYETMHDKLQSLEHLNPAYIGGDHDVTLKVTWDSTERRVQSILHGKQRFAPKFVARVRQLDKRLTEYVRMYLLA